MGVRDTVLALAILALTGCAPTTEAPQDGPHVLPGTQGPGGINKFQGYITVGKQEFDLFGEAHVVLPDNFYGYNERSQGLVAEGLADERYTEIWSAIVDHIQGRLDAANSGGWRNLWGVFGPPPGDPKFSMFWRNYLDDSVEITDITGYVATFRFTLGFLGSPDFQDFLVDPRSPGTFSIRAPESDLGARETIEIELKQSDSRDAFPRYRELFEDGVFDIGVHLGGDYNEDRYDLIRGRWFVDDFLLQEGWVSTTGVQSFDELTLESGPFVLDLILEGEPVQARIYVTHSDMSDSGDPSILAAPIEASFRTRDMVIFAGHAGPARGLIYDYQPSQELYPSQLEMADKYQIFVFQGCRTYHTLADDVLANPAKTADNVDVVTTFNATPFSAGYTVLQSMVELLTLASDEGDHYPVSWLRILARLNEGPGSTVQYGVHGVEQDPQLNPNRSAGVACTSCETDSDCAGGGNFCLLLENGGRCGVACTTDQACGYGFSCVDAFEDGDIRRALQCVPSNLRCR